MSTSTTRRVVPLAAVLVVALTALLMAVGMLAQPASRRRVRRRAEATWLNLEALADRQSRRLARRGRRLEEGARRVLDELWDLVDDLPFVPDRDRIPPLSSRMYAHGAFMGAAPLLLDDPRWRAILGFLMPDVFRDVRDAVRAGQRVHALIPMFENNPVVAAFGAVHAHRSAGDRQALEWDVYLDGAVVDAWEDERDPGRRDELVEGLVRTMVIAHASTTDTVQEQIGLCQWADVRRTPKSRLGGVEVAAWLDLFGRALALSRTPDLRAAIEAWRDEPRDDSELECRRHTFAEPWSSDRVAATYQQVTGQRLGVVLEIKSLRSTPELLAAVIRALNRRHVHVVAVGSFVPAEVRGLRHTAQVVGGADLPGPDEVLFLHFAADLQTACDAGQVERGSAVLFNGACLLRVVPGGPGRYEVDARVIDGLAGYRDAHDLRIGLYVQEYDCDGAAAALLAELVASRADVFALGFAWGELPDEVAMARGRGDHRGFGAQWPLQRMSRGWTHRRR